MTFPLIYRKKVFETKEKQNLTFQQTSDLFGISMKTLFRWHKKMQPCMTRRRPSQKIDLEKLKKDVEDHPDNYIWERAQRFGVSKSGIRAALIRLKITYKKKRYTIQKQTLKKETNSSKK